jgi:hypothetical protein
MDGNQPATPASMQTGLEPTPPAQTVGEITWTASEFIAHDKTGGWYGLLAVGAVVTAVVVWFITKDLVSPIVIVVAALMFGVYAKRKPRELSYHLDGHGLTIGDKYYDFGLFRSFSVVPEGGITSITFMPLKRFAPPITIYYDPNDQDTITKLLSGQLPFERRKQDPIDRLMWRIRF